MTKIKICIISKYPPIEGGVSSETYWLAKGLGEMGHEIFVVSNCWEVEEEYRELIPENELDKLEPRNVHLFSTRSLSGPSPVPQFNPYDAKLASLSIDVIRKYNPDIIFSHYLLPYGIAGFISKKITNKPLIVKHAGSDITNLFDSPFLRPLFIEVFKSADRIVTKRTKEGLLSSLGLDPNKFVFLSRVINHKEFHPDVKPFDLSEYTDKDINNIPIFTYLGKLNKLKNTNSFIHAAARIKDENFILLFVVGRGRTLEMLQNSLRQANLEDKTILLPFQPPWEIPSIMTASTCIVCPESCETPYLPSGTHFPSIAREAMSCGRCTIIGKGVYEKYKMLFPQIQDGINTYVINPENTDEFAEKMGNIIKNPDLAYEIGKHGKKISKLVLKPI